MVVLVCGDRNWSHYDTVLHTLRALPQITLVIHGGARGADTLGGRAARELDVPYKIFTARWDLYGKAAGPRRNQEMLTFLQEKAREGVPVTAFAFHQNLQTSRGTKDMIRRLELAKLSYTLIVNELR